MRLPSSFRDSHGFVFRRDGVVYRQVSEVHRVHFDALLSSGVYEELTGSGLLIPHEDDDVGLAGAPGVYRVLRPEQIPFVSYPFEWGFEQLRDAALATLDIQARALARGLSLRDATAYNITFHRGAPVLIDTTSFEIYEDDAPWVAYRQFCQHFLAPLALMAYRDIRLGQLLKLHLDGVPLDLASELLPRRAAARPGLAMHIRMHAKSQRKHEGDETPSRERGRAFSKQAFVGLIDSLRKAVQGLPEPEGASVWRDYYDEADHYSSAAATAKEAVVTSWIEQEAPSSVWDLGANVGRFARIASSRGIDAIGFEMDPFCVDEAYRIAKKEGDRHFLPLVQDLTNPSPGIGWANEERGTVLERGRGDLALALALIHHLAIANNVPLPMVADLISRLARSAIIEWIPKEDPKVQQLLRHREDIFDGYTREGFEASLAPVFETVRREPLPDGGRVLYHLRSRRG